MGLPCLKVPNRSASVVHCTRSLVLRNGSNTVRRGSLPLSEKEDKENAIRKAEALQAAVWLAGHWQPRGFTVRLTGSLDATVGYQHLRLVQTVKDQPVRLRSHA